MTFNEEILEDLDECFFDEDFFGSTHSLDGKEMVVIVDEDGLEEMNKTWKDELIKKPVLLYVKESDMVRKPSVNSVIEYDGMPYMVKNILKQSGVWKILLVRNGV